jgi:DNA-directed RNA polymerase specialized sigma24 family protein
MHVSPARSLDDLALAAQRHVPGTEDALVAELLERLRPIVAFAILSMKKGALGEADIDDVLQDLVVLVWRHDLAVFDPRRSGFLTFCNRRLRWHLADVARRARRRAGEECDDAALEEVIDVDKDPESLLTTHQRELAMLHLPKTVAQSGADSSAREVVVRCDLLGGKLTDVAKELDLHVSSACRARQRGLRFLARHLEAIV